jgi:hypothetical protein
MRCLICLPLLVLAGCSWETSSEPSEEERVPLKEETAHVLVTGELFVTTQGGDVKKAAGESVYLVPVSPEWRSEVESLFSKIQQASREELTAQWEGRPQLEELRAARQALDVTASALVRRGHTVIADSEGKFELEIPPGKYILHFLTNDCPSLAFQN